MSRVLVTGGAGFIGAHLARKLVEEGHLVDLVDDFSRGTRDAEVDRLASHAAVTIYDRDLLRAAALADMPRDYDLVFHFAAVVGVSEVRDAPFEVLTRNVEMLNRTLAFAAGQASLHRFVFASTSEVYAGSAALPSFGLPTPECVQVALPDLGEPRSTYLLSKIYGEAMCRHSGLPFTILRPHNVYGPRMGWSHVIPQLVERALLAEPGSSLTVYSPSHTRAFCHVSDAVEMIIRLALGEAGRNEIFNIGNQSEEISMKTLASRILSLVGTTLVLEEGPTTPGSPERRCPDMVKTTQATCFEPRVSLDDGLAETFDWYFDNQRATVAEAAA